MVEVAYTFHIHNFQSIRHLQLQFGGLVTITGQSDRGKSAIARALMALLHNEWHPSMLTEGEDTCTLSLTFHQHPTLQNITLEKSPKKAINKYTIIRHDGVIETTPKTGLSTPESMHELGIRKLETERGQKINTNYESQHDGIFLLGDTETAVTDLFNALFGTNLIEAALAKCNRDYQRASKEHGELSLTLQDRTKKAGELATRQQELTDQFSYHRQTLANYEAAASALESIQALQKQWQEASTNLIERRVACAKSEADRIVHEQALQHATPLATVVRHRTAHQLAVAEQRRASWSEGIARIRSAANGNTAIVVANFNQARAIRDQHRVKSEMYRQLTIATMKQSEQSDVLGLIGTAVRQFVAVANPIRAIHHATERLREIEGNIEETEEKDHILTDYVETILRPHTDICAICQKPIPRLRLQ